MDGRVLKLYGNRDGREGERRRGKGVGEGNAGQGAM
jgi:hypothetical protein